MLIRWLAVGLGCCVISFAAFAAGTNKKGIGGDFFWLGKDHVQVCEEALPIKVKLSFPELTDGQNRDRSKAGATDGEAAYWNQLALDLIVKYQRNPLRAARVLSLLNTAMHDARTCFAGSQKVEQSVAVNEAAARLLEYLFPQEPEGRFDTLVMSRMAAVRGITGRAFGIGQDAGNNVAFAAISRAISDGSGAVWDVHTRPAPSPAVWRATAPTYGNNPVEPLAGQWRTWVLRDGGEIQTSPPPAYGSPRYVEETKEVYQVSLALTDAQKAIADRWHLGSGTVTPVGVWNMEALYLAQQQGLSEKNTQDMLAALNVAMMDTSIACWRTKFTYWTVRPVNVIQEQIDSRFMPYLVTPVFPSYVSGHSAVSGAASQVLKAYFPKQAAKLTAMADEAAMSRLYGGIHFRSDNSEGLKLGQEIGRRVLAKVRGKPSAVRKFSH